jgi:hypothetical protein
MKVAGSDLNENGNEEGPSSIGYALLPFSGSYMHFNTGLQERRRRNHEGSRYALNAGMPLFSGLYLLPVFRRVEGQGEETIN